MTLFCLEGSSNNEELYKMSYKMFTDVEKLRGRSEGRVRTAINIEVKNNRCNNDFYTIEFHETTTFNLFLS